MGLYFEPGSQKSRRTLAVFAVFAVFAANYQLPKSRFPQKSWAADGSANKKTAERPLFSRCFCEKVARITKVALSRDSLSASFGEIGMLKDIITTPYCQLNKYLFGMIRFTVAGCHRDSVLDHSVGPVR